MPSGPAFFGESFAFCIFAPDMKEYLKNSIGYFAVVTLFSILFSSYRFFRYLSWDYLGVNNFIDFKVEKPFVYRTLISSILHFVHGVVPIKPSVLFWFSEFAACFIMAAMFGYYLYFFLKDVLLARIFSFSIFLVLPYIMLLPRYQPLWYPYDMWSVTFNILGLIFLYKRQWLPFYITFILATFNRETACFLTMVYLLVNYRQESNKNMALHFVAQLGLWFGIKIFLSYVFADVPGPVFQHQYMSNIKFFTDPYYEHRIGSKAFEMVFRLAYMVGNFAFVWLLVMFFHKHLNNLFLSRAALVIIPFFSGMLYVSNIFEYRIFGEMIPFILAPAVVILINMIRARTQSQST
ncbi:MAG: hypothetical protein V4543_12750 [Bacteroidota bacterium]